MYNSKAFRITVSALAFVFIFATGMGTAAYFMGFRGIGYGWPAFWANFALVCALFLTVGVLGGVLILALWWVKNAPAVEPKTPSNPVYLPDVDAEPVHVHRLFPYGKVMLRNGRRERRYRCNKCGGNTFLYEVDKKDRVIGLITNKGDIE